MRVIIAGSETDLWCTPPDDRAHLRLVSSFLEDDAIISMSQDQWEEVRRRLARSIAEQGTDTPASQLLEVLRLAPMSPVVSKPPVDAFLGDLEMDPGHTPLVSASCDPEITSLSRKRKSALDVAKTRGQLYNELIRPFAATATKVRLLDPWAAADVTNEAEGIPWLVDALFADGIKEIEILSLRDERITQGIDRARLERIWAANASPDRSLRFVMAKASGDAHDRHLRFIYPDGARSTPVVTLGRGASVFNNESIRTPPTVTDATTSQRAAEEREGSILRSVQFKSSYQFPERESRRPLRGPESLMRR